MSSSSSVSSFQNPFTIPSLSSNVSTSASKPPLPSTSNIDTISSPASSSVFTSIGRRIISLLLPPHEEVENLMKGYSQWGAGNWKSIPKDPGLVFNNWSPVDPEDRFKTYFPYAYEEQYSNPGGYFSSRIRASGPDGKSLSERTRNMEQCPFTEEEDRALRAGYEKHGAFWAEISKDPIFQEQKRQPVDLRDRFRKAFPDLYKAAYERKPAETLDLLSPAHAAIDDQIPVLPPRRKRANLNEESFRRGAKSVPQSAAGSDGETSADGTDGDLVDVQLSGTGRRTVSTYPKATGEDLVTATTGNTSQTTMGSDDAFSQPGLSRRPVSPTTTKPPRPHSLDLTFPTHNQNNKTRSSFLVLLFTTLEYPPFNEVIHWDGVKRVVLEQPQILESYILMPVFGLRTLGVFKQKLYTLGFDGVLHRAPGPNADPETSAWEHPTMTRLNPPMGFTSHDWSEETLDWPRRVESETEWVQVVNEFISRCEDLYKMSETAPSPVLPPSPPSFPPPSSAPLPAPKPSFAVEWKLLCDGTQRLVIAVGRVPGHLLGEARAQRVMFRPRMMALVKKWFIMTTKPDKASGEPSA